MISLCTVLTNALENYLPIMLESISLKTELVSEVLICKIDSPDSLKEEWNVGKIKFIKFGYPVKDMWYGHPLGLHECIKMASNEYIYFCDPDIFFYSPIEKIFLELMQKYDINYIGCSHHAAILQAYTYFPYLVSSMVKKKDLPDEEFLKGKLKFRRGVLHSKDLSDNDDYPLANGKYLICSPIPGCYDNFPNKDPKYAPCYYDTSCNLWLWALEKDWKYLSFQTTDCHTYTTGYCRGNIKLKEKLKKRNLIYHNVGGSNVFSGDGKKIDRPEEFEIFQEKYKEILEDD